MTSSGQQPIERLRFFAGEAQWISNQLEAELAQGKWMLLAPNAELLQRIALHPQSFDPRWALFSCILPSSCKGLHSVHLLTAENQLPV